MVSIRLKKIVVAAILTSVAVVIDLIFKQVLPGGFQNIFGFPFYAIPLVIGSIILGPFYALVMAFIADFMGVLLSGQTYQIWFIFSALVWGLIPGIFLKLNSKFLKILIVVGITHILATMFNTYALSVYGWLRLNELFFVRLLMIPFNVTIITSIIYQVNNRLIPVYENILN